MDRVNPQLAQNLLKEIKEQESKLVNVGDIKIETCPGVFPPQSQFSNSSIGLNRLFGDLSGKSVLDLGTGTGIQAIQAYRLGATEVLAIDINDSALACARRNISLNDASDRIRVIKSDLFDDIPRLRFDLIIANLPISDFPVRGVIESSLYDPDYNLHQRFLEQASEYLNPNGKIVITHANFNGDGDFDRLEKMFAKAGFVIDQFIEEERLGYKWRFYRIAKKA